jgi:hypothetical protein
LLWLFWRWGFANYLPGLASNHDPLDLASQVARIIDVSYQSLANFGLCIFPLKLFPGARRRKLKDAPLPTPAPHFPILAVKRDVYFQGNT